jgi:hypothetical protein
VQQDYDPAVLGNTLRPSRLARFINDRMLRRE